MGNWAVGGCLGQVEQLSKRNAELSDELKFSEQKRLEFWAELDSADTKRAQRSKSDRPKHARDAAAAPDRDKENNNARPTSRDRTPHRASDDDPRLERYVQCLFPPF